MFCKKCGIELSIDSDFCPQCGTQQTKSTICESHQESHINSTNIPNQKPIPDLTTTTQNTQTIAQHKYQTAIKIFLILACVFSISLYLIPLIWSIPMTVWYFEESKNRRPLSAGYKICTFLFVSSIAGILMLVDN